MDDVAAAHPAEHPAAPAVAPPGGRAFRYVAADGDGRTLSGTLDAADYDAARAALARMGLDVAELAPADRAPAARAGTLDGEALADFTRQLGHLAAAGLPLERGLRLIADDLKRGRVAATVRELAAKLEAGAPPDEAVRQMSGRLPPTFGPLLAAGMRTGQLPAVLLSLGRHQELVARLKGDLRRALAYPAAVLLALTAVLLFISLAVLPGIEAIYADFAKNELVGNFSLIGSGWQNYNQPILLPLPTRVLFWLGYVMPFLAMVVLGLFLLAPAITLIARRTGRSQALAEKLLWVPLVGPVLRHGTIGRWLGVAKVGVDAGLDFPAALDLADAATGSPRLAHDAGLMRDALVDGRPLTDVATKTKLLPATVPAALQHAADRADLPHALGVLAELHDRQAEHKLRRIPLWLTPTLLLLIGGLVSLVLLALLAPLMQMLRAITY